MYETLAYKINMTSNNINYDLTILACMLLLLFLLRYIGLNFFKELLIKYLKIYIYKILGNDI